MQKSNNNFNSSTEEKPNKSNKKTTDVQFSPIREKYNDECTPRGECPVQSFDNSSGPSAAHNQLYYNRNIDINPSVCETEISVHPDQCLKEGDDSKDVFDINKQENNSLLNNLSVSSSINGRLPQPAFSCTAEQIEEDIRTAQKQKEKKVAQIIPTTHTSSKSEHLTNTAFIKRDLDKCDPFKPTSNRDSEGLIDPTLRLVILSSSKVFASTEINLV